MRAGLDYNETFFSQAQSKAYMGSLLQFSTTVFPPTFININMPWTSMTSNTSTSSGHLHKYYQTFLHDSHR